MTVRYSSLKAIPTYSKRKASEYSPGKFRSDFMRDRDRVLYSNPFRRLSRKTQIFLPASDDHIRTRLTHSLEVAQIAVTSAMALGLDRDLAEAIALAHDLGHTPFGHTGERILNLISNGCDSLGNSLPKISASDMGFKHNLQGLRVTSELANLYHNLCGLNLTNFTLWGIANHTGKTWKNCAFRDKSSKIYTCNNPQRHQASQCIHSDIKSAFENHFYDKYHDLTCLSGDHASSKEAWSFEGYLVKIADEISQRHHDIEDGLIAGIIQDEEIYELVDQLLKPHFNREEKRIFNSIQNANSKQNEPIYSKLVVGCINRSLIENTQNNFKQFFRHYDIRKRSDFKALYPTLMPDNIITTDSQRISISSLVSLPEALEQDDSILQNRLSNIILKSYEVQRMDGKATYIIRQLAKAYLTNPQQLPNICISQLFDLCYQDNASSHNITIGDKRAWIDQIYRSIDNENVKKNLLRVIIDFLSGMTDDFALLEHSKLYSTTENINLRHY